VNLWNHSITAKYWYFTNIYTKSEIDAFWFAILPSQTWNNGKFLFTNWTDISWEYVPWSWWWSIEWDIEDQTDLMEYFSNYYTKVEIDDFWFLTAETDPVFSQRLIDTPPLYSETDPIFMSWLDTDPLSWYLKLDQTTPQTLNNSPDFQCNITVQWVIHRQWHTVTRDIDGNIETITYDNLREVTYTRDVDWVITSYTDWVYEWTINRDVDWNYTGTTFTTL
jgi:hypothetical protein